MEHFWSTQAYAKVNLHLQVLNKKEDGYHNLLSLMVKVGLADLLQCEKAETGDPTPLCHPEILIRSVTGRTRHVVESLSPDSNLIVKAGTAYLLRQQANERFYVDLEKNIPAGAGLGGGSTDAAAMLNLMADALPGIDVLAQHQIARKLGADVPYCMQDKPAICEGIGDLVTPLDGKLFLHAVIVNNNIHVDTRNAYILLGRTGCSTLDTEEIERKKTVIRRFVETSDLAIAGLEFVNDFEKAVFCMHPEIEKIKEDVYRAGADFAIMTGSGSSVVGLFNDKRSASTASALLGEKYSFVCNTCII